MRSARRTGRTDEATNEKGPPTLELVESRATSDGLIIEVYRPAGRPQYAMATTS